MVSHVRSKWMKLLPHIVCVFVYMIWGLNIVSMKVGGEEWNPLVFNGLRYLFITPILWFFVWMFAKGDFSQLHMRPGDLWLNIGLGVLSAVGMEAVLSYALQYSNTANGALLGRGFIPILAAIVALSIRQIRLTIRLCVGIPLALISVIIVVSSSGLHFGPETLRGDFLLLMRGFMGVVYLYGMARLVGRYPIILIIAIEMAAGAVALFPFLITQLNWHDIVSMPSQGWMSLFYTAIFATVIGFYIHNWSLNRLGPFKASVYGYLLPLTAAVAGYVLLDESITLNQYIGGAGILIAMYLVQRDRLQEWSHTDKKQEEKHA